MANGAFKFKDNSGNVVSFISGSGSNISFSGGTLDLSGMTGLTLGNLTLSGTTQNALSASHAASYLLTSSFNTYSGTTDTVIGTLQTSTSSLNSFTSSATTRLNSIETSTGSLNSYTSSNTTNINAIHTSTGSLNTFTSSATSRLNSIEGVSGSYATTGSNQFKNDQVITGSLTVTGFIDAQELRTTYISSSILYRSGSTKFGDELSDTHTFTGSLSVSGSISVPGSGLISGSSQILNGSGVFSGSAQLPSGIVSSSAQTIANLPSGTVSGSVQIDVMSTTNIARLATTGSNIFTSNQIVTGSISSTGNIKSEGVLQWNSGIGSLSYGGGSVTMETNTSTPILLKTNGTTAITISTGQTVTFANNIGVGISSPQQILSVNNPFSTLNAVYPIAISQQSSNELGGIYSVADSITNPIGAGLVFKVYQQNVGLVEKFRIANSGFATFSSSVQTTDLRYSGSGYLTYGTGALGTETFIIRNGVASAALTIAYGGASTFSDRIQITSNGGTNPVLAIRQSNAATQGYDFETEDVSVGRLDLYGVTSGGRVQMMTWIKLNGRVGIGAIAPKTKLQVTPVSNAEVPVLGTATGVAIFTSANTNYGLQFNSTSDGSFHIQSQRFDASATAYNLILNYAGGNIGIGGNTSPGCSLDIGSRTDAIALPKGTTAQRPASPSSGMGRFNTEISKTEFYNGTVWVTVGGTGDGSTSSSPASSAKAIKAAVGNPTSGVYWLQVANVNGGNPFQCYCDFTMNGGIGYAIITNQFFEGAETGPSHANFASSTVGTAGYDTEYIISPSAMLANYGVTKLAVFARVGGTSSGGINNATYTNWVAFSGPTSTQYNTIFTQGFGSTQFTGTFVSADGNTGTAYFPNSHGNTGGVTQITTNGGTVNDYLLYEYKQGTGTDPNHFWMVLNGRSGDTYWAGNTRYGSSSGNVMYNRWGGVALY